MLSWLMPMHSLSEMVPRPQEAVDRRSLDDGPSLDPELGATLGIQDTTHPVPEDILML